MDSCKVLSILLFVIYLGYSTGRVLFKPGPYNGHDCDERFNPRHVVDCNTCKCKQGNFIDCSRYRCTTDFTKPFLLTCVEREYKIGHCEICQCYNESWACQQFPCKDKVRLTRSIPRKNDVRLCSDGAIRKDDCNECECNDGIWECRNDNSCQDVNVTPFFSQQQLNKVPCTEEDGFEIDCKYCLCNANRIGYTCRNVDNCKVDIYSDWHFRSAKKYWEIRMFLDELEQNEK